jgi:NADPH2:quinone reductase
MRAVEHTEFGSPEELKLIEVEKPVPKDNEVLVKIHATTVTTSDCNMRNLNFAPKWAHLPYKIFKLGVFRPRIHRLGIEMSGEIELVGSNVKRFRIGDKVFGSPEPGLGTHAEYICIPEDRGIIIKPDGMPWNEASAMTLAGNTALYYIRDIAKLKKGQKILINGASGGIGTFAVQLAKYYGAEVTSVCSTKNITLVKSLGSDMVIDYIKEDFTMKKEEYDIIYDVVNKISFSDCKDSLKKEGIYLAGAGQEFLQTALASFKRGRKVKSEGVVTKIEDLEFLKGLYLQGKLKVVIDREFDLNDIVEAFKYVETGHKKGSVVIRI